MSENDSNATADCHRQMLVEGTDFYFENGLMVLTEKFLKERGVCCGNKCTHCPYGWENVPGHSR